MNVIDRRQSSKIDVSVKEAANYRAQRFSDNQPRTITELPYNTLPKRQIPDRGSRCLQGDREASIGKAMSEFHSLLEVEIPRLRRYARALVRDADRADDLVQDTLMRALTKQHLWAPGTNLRAWLFTLMHNQHVNNVRRPAREAVQLDMEEMSGSLIATTDPTASCQMRELENALARLRREEREVILLVGLEGMRYDDTALILGVPIGTVRSRLFRGREALRKLLDMDEPASAPAPSEPAELPEAA
jgi:RNA polymerase sigma-70 factor (ECF subfamily)